VRLELHARLGNEAGLIVGMPPGRCSVFGSLWGSLARPGVPERATASSGDPGSRARELRNDVEEASVGRDAALDWLRQNQAEGVHVTPAGDPELHGLTVAWPMTLRILRAVRNAPGQGSSTSATDELRSSNRPPGYR
jgi:hypothetical protein